MGRTDRLGADAHRSTSLEIGDERVEGRVGTMDITKRSGQCRGSRNAPWAVLAALPTLLMEADQNRIGRG